MRYRYLLLMISATALSIGGTGFTLLIIATPLLLIRSIPPHVFILVIAVAIIGLCMAYMFDVPLPLLSRLDELNHQSFSGSQRLLISAIRFVSLIFDPSYLLTGTGAGSTSADSGNPWPILKVTNEYGVVAMISFVIFYMSVVLSNKFDRPLKVALSVIFHFTGGYLVDPFIVNFLAILCLPETRTSRSALIPPNANG
jgi:hypothetical protein